MFPAIFENESEMQIKMKNSEDHNEREMENESGKCIFSYSTTTSMRNFEAFNWNISSSIINFFQKSELEPNPYLVSRT